MAKKKQGFAAISKKRMRELASMGGKAAHLAGTAHEFTSKEASKAGKKGGATVSQDHDHMAKIGRKGGLTAQANGTAYRLTSVTGKAASKKRHTKKHS